MNIRLFLSLWLGLFTSVFLWGQDLPNPDSNIQLIETGSYIIPMDNEKQTTVALNMNDIFNTKTYGLLYTLLDNGIPIKWVIRSGKEKDEIDFTAYSRRIFPSSSQPDTLDFRASAFVIDINDMRGSVCQANIDPMGEINTLVADFGEEVSLYLLLEDMAMDVRYELSSAPVVGVLSDGGSFTGIQQALLDETQIPYDELNTQDFIDDNGCYTFIGQAHIEENQVSSAYANGVKTYVENGGNFFAQCHGLISYENEENMQTTNGYNYQGFFNSGGGTNSPNDFLNNDLAIMQFEGVIDLGSGGTTLFNLAPGSNLQPYAYASIVDMETNGNIGEFLATGADLNDTIPGGNIWYAVGHDYMEQGFSWTNPFNNDAIQRSNAKRVFLNTIFVPANISFACAGNDICICPGDSVILGCGNINLEQDYVWTPTDGLSCSNCPRPKASPSSTTTYTMNQANGNCALSTITINILEPIDTSNYEVVCDPSSDSYTVSFDIIGGNSSDFSVDGLAGILNGSNFISDPITSEATYAFEISDELNCGKAVNGTHECLCTATATISGGGDICNDGTTTTEIQFTLEGNAPWTITYAINGMPQPTISTMDNNYIHTSNIDGTYTLLSIEDADCSGAIDNDTNVAIIIYDEYETMLEVEMCEGEFYDFDGNNILAGETQSFSYTTQQGCDSIINVQVNEKNGSTASLDTFLCEGTSLMINGSTLFAGNQENFTFTNDQGCDSIYSVNIQTLDFDIDLGIDVEIFFKETVQLNVNSQNNIASYQWSPASSLSCTDCPNPIALPNSTTTYQLIATDEDGCISLAQKLVNVIPFVNDVLMPTAFSPNGDGQNDFVSPTIRGSFTDYFIMIYDRWGEELFTTDDIQEEWDGRYNNTNCELGVYLYHVKVTFTDGTEQVLNGNVTLIR